MGSRFQRIRQANIDLNDSRRRDSEWNAHFELQDRIVPKKKAAKAKRRAIIRELFRTQPNCSKCGEQLSLGYCHRHQALLVKGSTTTLECLKCRNDRINAEAAESGVAHVAR